MAQEISIHDRTYRFPKEGPALLRSNTGEGADRINLASAAAQHCFWQRDYIHDYVALPKGQVYAQAMGCRLAVAGYGKAYITSSANRLFILRRVYHCPDLTENLFSLSKLDANISVSFSTQRGGKLTVNGNELLCAFPYKGKYYEMQGVVRIAPDAKRVRRAPPDDSIISFGMLVEKIDQDSLGVHREIPGLDGDRWPSTRHVLGAHSWSLLEAHKKAISL